MKKRLLSMLAFLGVAAIASAQVTFTCTAGKNFGQNEGIDKLFDGNINTKYCQDAGDDCYALVTASEPVFVWGYDMSTANDNEQYGRCVKRWTLCGTNDENVAKDPNAAGWVTLSGFGANNFVQQKNFYTQRFFCDKASVATAYKYFKVVLNEGGFIQVSEFAFCYETQPVVTYNWVEGSNNDTKKAVDWLLGQKWEGSGGNSIVGKYFVIETSDGKPHPVKSYSMTTHDDGSWNDRAPKSWKLEGSNDKNEWITIDEVIDDETIQNENYKTFEFTPSNTTDAVRYLKLTINAIKGSGYTQLGEFHVKGGYQYTPGTCPEHDILGTHKDPTCAEGGYDIGTCWKCGNSGTTPIPATGAHNYKNGCCTVCSGPDASYMSAVDGFYQPTSVEEFTWLAAMIQAGNNVNIKLTQDVDLTGFAGFGNGDDVKPFKGEFDGQGHWLQNLRIDVSKKNTGLFGMVENANIHDLGLTGADVKINTSMANAAALIGNAKNTTLNRVAVMRSYVEGHDHVGAIVGNTEGNTVVTNCLSDANIKSRAYQAGGLIGTTNGLTLENCLFIGSVANDGNNAGGLVALLDSEKAATTIRNNISAASQIKAGSGSQASIMVTAGRSATFENNRISTSTLFGENINFLTDANDENGLSTDEPVMQCKSFLSTTMGWDMTNDWKMIQVGEWPVLAWMEGTTPTQSKKTEDDGYYTMFAEADLEFEGTGLTAYAATVVNNDHVHLEEVTSVPRGEVVIVKSDEPGTFGVPYAVDWASGLNNELLVSQEDVQGDGSTIFALGKKNGVVGFYPVKNGITVPMHKGYLRIENSNPAKAYPFYFGGEEETAISSVATEAEGAVIYNLAGQRIQKMQKGVNVVNGKKVMF